MGNLSSKAYSALTVAKYVLEISKEKDIEMNNLKLQKILYFIQGLYLVNYQKRLFNDEIEKWYYGPVVPAVYHKYKNYRSNRIEYTSDFNSGAEINFFEKDESVEKDDLEFISIVVTKLGKYKAFELVDVTHRHLGWKKDRDRIVHGIKNITYTDDELINDMKIDKG